MKSPSIIPNTTVKASTDAPVLDINGIIKDSITGIVKEASLGIYNVIKKKIRDRKVRSEIEIGSAFETYLNHAFEKYSRIKTLLYRREPQYLYDFFEPTNILHRRQTISTDNVSDIISLGNKLIVTGTGGIGKTTLLKHFFIDCIRKTRLIPVFVELRQLNNTRLSLEKFIFSCLQTLGFNLDEEYFEYSLETNCYLFLFDGFDEIEYKKKKQITLQLCKFADKYRGNYFVLSSRPSQEFIGWNDFIEIRSLGLTKNQAVSLIKRSIYSKEIKEKFIKDLSSHLYKEHETFASNPLLLNIMLLTYEEHASFPSRLTDFYDQAFIALFNAHDATKEGFSRDIRSGLSYGDFKGAFSHFCFMTFFKSKYIFGETMLDNVVNR